MDKSSCWDHPYSKFVKNGKTYSGTYYYSYTMFSFSITQNNRKGARYPFRGTVSLLSPADGKVLQVTGKQKVRIKKNWSRKNPNEAFPSGRQKRLNATRQIHSSKTDATEQDLKRLVEEAAQKLYADNAIALEGIVENIHISQQTFSFIVNFLGKSIIRKLSPHGNENTRNRKLSRLKTIATYFGDTPIEKITFSKVQDYCTTAGGSANENLKLASDCIEYLREYNTLRCKNPFDDVLKGTRKGVNSAAGNRAVNRVNHLEPAEYENLCINLWKDIENRGDLVGVLLISECGFSPKEACALTWNDLIIWPDEDLVSIQFNKTFIGSAIHDYKRPVSPFAKYALLKRREKLRSNTELSESDFQKMPIASLQTDPAKPMNAKDLANRVKYFLRDLEISDNNAVKLLEDNYEFRLKMICKMEDAPIRYMCGRSMKYDVTSNNYRCFSDLEGQLHLSHYLERHAWLPDEKKIKTNFKTVKNEMGQCVTTIQSGNHHLSSFHGLAHLRGGESIKVLAPKGARITVKAIANPQK